MNTDLVVHGDNLSEAWARTVVAVAAETKQKAFHVVTRISDPTSEDARIREMADGILAERDMPPVDTVANTLFPRAMARRTPDAEALGKRYLDLLPTLERLDAANRRGGTYFERLVNYETTTGHLNQLAELIRRLKQESALRDNPKTGPKSARYEVPLEQLTASLPISEAEHDTNPMGFPCLTLLSFQLDDDCVHVLAHYRSHYLFEKAYGNYIAVCALLQYVCEQTGLAPGRVTVVAGTAKVDEYRKGSVKVLDEYLNTDVLI